MRRMSGTLCQKGETEMPANIAEVHSVFEQPWWLDAVAPGEWDAVEIEENGRTVARLPFVLRKTFGMRVLTQPALTQTLGPWVEHNSANPARRLAREKDLFSRLIARLPHHDIFQQNFHSQITNWLPFYWAGFQQTTRYSYAIADLSDLERVQSGFSKTTRHLIRKAGASLSVSQDGTIDDLVRLAELSFRRQGLPLPYSPDLVHRIDEAVGRRAERRLFIAVDDDGVHHAAVYTVGDANRVYSIVTGADPEFRANGAVNLLYWEAMKAASGYTRVFDFEGSMIPGVEEHYRKFGGVPVPYSSVSRATGAARIAVAARQLWRR